MEKPPSRRPSFFSISIIADWAGLKYIGRKPEKANGRPGKRIPQEERICARLRPIVGGTENGMAARLPFLRLLECDGPITHAACFVDPTGKRFVDPTDKKDQ